MLYLLAIGINFTGTPYMLRGCVNDAKNVAKYLQTDRSVILTDDRSPSDPYYPSRENVFRHFRDLVSQMNHTDILYFHFSGHGFFIDRNNGGALTSQGGSIAPGLKECILVRGKENTNIVKENTICHSEFNDLFSLIPAGMCVFGMIDSCDSGTVFDLAYNVRVLKQKYCPDFCPLPTRDTMEFYLKHNSERHCYRGKIVLMVSVKEQGVAWDTTDDQKQPCGAFTDVFLKTLRRHGRNLSYLDILYLTHNKVGNRFKQDPQLSCCDLKMLNRRFLT